MREDLPLREITLEEIYAEVQRLRSELQTHNHLDIGSAQVLTGTMNGIIQSSNFKTGSSGCQINWATGNIEANSGNFRGDITGASGTFSGSLTATTGTIGGWTIGANSLSAVSGGNTTILSSGATAFSAGPTGSPTVTITQAGVLTCTGANIRGTLNVDDVNAGTLSVTYTAAKCTDASADQTSAHTANNAANYTGNSISTGYTAAKCTDALADQTSAHDCQHPGDYTASHDCLHPGDYTASHTANNAANYTGNTITGVTIRSGSGNDRVELTNADRLRFYKGGSIVGQIFSGASYLTIYGDGTNLIIIGNVTNGAGLIIAGNLVDSKTIKPQSTNTHYLGTTDYRWKYLYLNNLIDFGSAVSNIQQGGSVMFAFDHTSGTIACDEHFIPNANNTYDLGDTSHYWQDVYLDYLRFNSTYGRIYWGANLVEDFYAAEVRFSKNVVAATAGSQNLGSAGQYWNDVSYKTLTDRGCLGVFDEGVELQNGKKVSDIGALKNIKKHPKLKTTYGVPRFDYSSMPKVVYKPAPIAKKDVYNERDEKKLLYKKGEKMGEDGAETTALISIMIGAIKELSAEVDKLKQQ